jgi:hypothetical protein
VRCDESDDGVVVVVVVVVGEEEDELVAVEEDKDEDEEGLEKTRTQMEKRKKSFLVGSQGQHRPMSKQKQRGLRLLPSRRQGHGSAYIGSRQSGLDTTG